MLSLIWTTIITKPFYNAFIFLMHLLPFADAGVIIVIFTIIIKFILFPLSIKASRAQLQMKSIEKDLADIKEKYKDNKEEQSKQTIEYYREKGINPFASFFILLVQLPIIIGLYRVFLKSGLPVIDTALLYSFVPAVASVNMMFFGLIDIAQKSLVLAILAGLTTYIQLDQASKTQAAAAPSQSGKSMQADIAQTMTKQMKYFFPIIVIFISYSISAAVALYWITSNVFAIVQEIYIKKKYHQAVFVE